MPRGGRPLALRTAYRVPRPPPGGRHFEGVGRTLPQFCTLFSTLRQQRIRWPGHNGRFPRSAWPVFRMAPQRGPSTRDGGPDSVTKSSKLCRIGRRGSYGVAIKRHGLTPPGRQRWRRKRCGAAFARRIDSSAKPPRSLPGRAPLEGSEEDAAGAGRTSWRKRALFWKLWPASPPVDEIGKAVFPDGIWAGRSAAVPVACPREDALAGHPAQSESGASWTTPMAKGPPRHGHDRRSRRLCHRQRGP